jgi:streptogramin lyase
LTTDYSNIAIDGNYTVWVTGGGTGSLGGTSGYPYVYQFLYSSTSPNYPSTPSATTNAGGIAEPEQAISIDSNNYVWVENYGAEKVSCIWGTSTISALTVPYAVQANLTKPEFQVTDGAGNLWVADAATTVASPAGSVYEISNAGVSIAPAVGFAHTYNEPYGIAIDPSGNVWVAAYAGAEPNGFITEIVGQAVPVVTPIAAGLPTTPGGTNRLGTRP